MQEERTAVRKKEHPHPRRAARAKRIAQGVAAGGLLMVIVGLVYVFLSMTSFGGWPTGLIPAGTTAILLAAIWYFSYMEQLEPELYEHDQNVPNE